MKKVFISHSSKDKAIIGDIITLLESSGLKHTEIFCSSFEPYNVPIGEDFLEYIKKQLSDEVYVIFVITKNFLYSNICWCEFGATWINSSEKAIILVPPLKFSDLPLLVQKYQGIFLNDKEAINSFHSRICTLFDLNRIDSSIWERRRDEFIVRINEKIENVYIKTIENNPEENLYKLKSFKEKHSGYVKILDENKKLDVSKIFEYATDMYLEYSRFFELNKECFTSIQIKNLNKIRNKEKNAYINLVKSYAIENSNESRENAQLLLEIRSSFLDNFNKYLDSNIEFKKDQK